MANNPTITFCGHVFPLKEDRRCGVCNSCRAVFGEVDAQRNRIYRVKNFHLHHELYYFNNILAHTIELCPMCHGEYNTECKGGSYRQDFNEILIFVGNCYT